VPVRLQGQIQDLKMIRDTCARDPAHREQILRAEKTYGGEIKKGSLKPR
jgi:hypothetical protein